MRLLLVDATNLVMRAAAAVCGADPESGPVAHAETDSTAFGMMEKACRELEASHVIMAWDSPAELSERRKLYPGYKGSRTGKTKYWVDRLRPQFDDAHWFGLSWPGWEADDVIATLVRRVNDRGTEPAILSNDSDLLALARDAACYQWGRKDEGWIEHRSPRWVHEKYGVGPEYLTTLKALAGEPNDDMPGPFGKHCIVRARRILKLYLDEWDGDGAVEPIEALVALGHLVGPFVEKARLARDVLTLREDLPLPPVAPSTCRVPGTY